MADLTGTPGDDTLTGTSGADTLDGGAGNDFLDGGYGSDTLIGGPGDDRLQGGGSLPGDVDVAVYSGNRSDYSIAVTFPPDSGVPVYVVTDLRPNSPDGRDLLTNVEIFRFADRDFLISEIGAERHGTDSGEYLRGTAGNDSLFGEGGNDTLGGGDGDDEMSGGAGNDTIYGGQGFDTAVFSGTMGNYAIEFLAGGEVRVTDLRPATPDGVDLIETDVEAIRFADVSVTLNNVAGVYIYSADPAAETLVGTDGNDQIFGGREDTLIGGAGSDDLFGGVLDGGPGNDTLEFNLYYPGIAVFSGNRSDYEIILDPVNRTPPKSLGYTSFLVRDLRLGSPDGFDLVINPTVFRFADGDVKWADIGIKAFGTDGSDGLYGTNGADLLTGGPGDDTLIGLGGDDTLTGGSGNDLLSGGDGLDTAVFSASRADYAVVQLRSGDYEVRDLRPGSPDGTDHLNKDVERLQFADGIRIMADIAVLRDVRYDFNGDGYSDIAFQHNSGAFAWWSGPLQPFYSTLTGPGANPLDSSWKIVGVGDFDGDGKDDLLWRYSSGELAEWQGQKSGFGSTQQPTPNFINVPGIAPNAVDTSWSVVGVADYNGDGRDDILWRHTSGALAEWTARADGTFVNNGAAFTSAIDLSWKVVASGDFNGDGLADVLWQHSSGAFVAWHGTLSGVLVNAGPVLAGASGNIIGSADFNDDGRDDLLTRAADGTITEWLSQSNGQFTAVKPTAQVLDLNWQIDAIADYNGDGFSDLLWRHSSGELTVWLGAADGQFPSTFAPPQVDTSWQVQSPDLFT